MKNVKILMGALCAAGFVTMCSCNNDKYVTIPETEDAPALTSGDVKVLTTTSNRSQDLNESWLVFSDKDNMNPSSIYLDPSKTYQTMDGFGAAITGSTCYNLMRMTPQDRKDFIRRTFSPTEGYGFSYVRIAIGCSDFSLSEYTLCDKEGIENFALTSEENDYVIPILKEILAVNPELKIMGTPWTPPRWMKVNNLTDKQPYNSWTSGHLNPDYYADYALYFSKWVKAFADNGIKIYSVTPQNEPLNRGNSASCYMGWEEEKEFVKHLGKAFENAGQDVKIYAFDHNYNYDNIASEKSYPVKIFADADASKYLAGSAFHNYGGSPEELTNVFNAAPGKELVFTETSIGEWNDGRNLSTRLVDDMEQVALGTVNRNCKGVIVWNLMLDTDKGPYRPGGCSTCYGAVDLGSNLSSITRNSHYYIIAHMSSAVKPGATRIGTTGFTKSGLTYSAFKNTDGSYAIVLCNANDETFPVTFDDGTHHFSTKVPARSVVSYSWK